MSKPFSVVYQGPYQGLNVQAPANLIDVSASPATKNFFFRNAELRSRPTFVRLFPGPETNNPALGEGSFMDSNGVWHTVTFTALGLYQLDGNNTTVAGNPWQFVGGPQLIPVVPVAWQAFVNNLYYTNGGTALLQWDGLQLLPSVASFLADGVSSVGGFYLGELADHLILANVTQFDNATNTVTNFPQRLWWSANGLPNVWDPTVNTSAGFDDLLETPDVITGQLFIGNVGYVFRTNGITQVTPTGRGLVPFAFNHLWASKQGIGNIYPWSIASYGSFGVFISYEQVYQIAVNSFQEIGGGSRDAVLADLALATANPSAEILGAWNYGYSYLAYVLAIPIGTFTRFYVYSFEDKSWTKWDAEGIIVTGRPFSIWR